jgi:hypothetical protein
MREMKAEAAAADTTVAAAVAITPVAAEDLALSEISLQHRRTHFLRPLLLVAQLHL